MRGMFALHVGVRWSTRLHRTTQSPNNNNHKGLPMKLFTQSLSCLGALALALGATQANAASLQVFTGYSFTNPASLAYVKDLEIDAGLDTVFQDIQFSGNVTVLNPMTLMPAISDTGVSHSREPLYFPTGRVAKRINDKWVAGVSIATPYNSDVAWSLDSIPRYVGTNTQIRSFNIAPQVSLQATDRVTFGAGVDIQRLQAELDSVVPFATFGLPSDAQFNSSGDSWGVGWHLGTVVRAAEGTFLALTYYSKISHHLTGESSFEFSPTPTSDVDVRTQLPPTVILDAVQYFSPEWLVKATLSYTQWDQLRELRLRNSAMAPILMAAVPGSSGDVVIPLEYKNSFRAGLSTRYELNKQWVLLASVSYDKSPSNIHDLSVRAPDGDVYTVAGGVKHNINEHVTVAFAYAHSFVSDAKINNISGNVLTQGVAKIRDDTISMSVSYKS